MFEVVEVEERLLGFTEAGDIRFKGVLLTLNSKIEIFAILQNSSMARVQEYKGTRGGSWGGYC